jgi:hypothetical protein
MLLLSMLLFSSQTVAKPAFGVAAPPANPRAAAHSVLQFSN